MSRGQGRGAQWHIGRWRMSSAYRGMSLAEQGAYRNVLEALWRNGGYLPDDEQLLAEACGRPEEWPTVRVAVLMSLRLTNRGWARREALITRLRCYIPAWIRKLVFDRDGGQCVFCGSPGPLEYDHIQRVREGGPDTPDNLRLLCTSCNRARG